MFSSYYSRNIYKTEYGAAKIKSAETNKNIASAIKCEEELPMRALRANRNAPVFADLFKLL